ncbi:hypothetical protein AFL94_07175 [Arthrobacter sp. LS16]|nr:hypothetical protein AFL94_07175 [Arthrobacter sp. LS16]
MWLVLVYMGAYVEGKIFIHFIKINYDIFRIARKNQVMSHIRNILCSFSKADSFLGKPQLCINEKTPCAIINCAE